MAEEKANNEREQAEQDAAAREQPEAEAAEHQGEADVAVDADALATRVEDLEQQLGEAKDQALRALAEAQNARNRAEKDVESARKYALESFASDLLPVVDNLERALALADAKDDAAKALLEGIELTRRSFLDVLSRHQIEQVDPVGEPFNPQYHEAITMIEKPEAEPNTVLEVMQKGYTLNGRLVRAAMVVVSRAPAPRVDETV